MHVSLQSQSFLIFSKRSVEFFHVNFYILCETELNIGSHNLKRKASYPGSPIFTHIGAQSGNAWNRKCSAAVSDYDRVRNIPFHRGRQLDPLFIILFPGTFFREHRFIRRRRLGNVSRALQFRVSTRCHAKCNAHAMQP